MQGHRTDGYEGAKAMSDAEREDDVPRPCDRKSSER
jgi:hypothetical protein